MSADRTLRGDHNRCPSCGLYFNSTAAFDKHRTGSFNNPADPRRCLAVDEMRAAGMAINADGWWVTARMAGDSARRRYPPTTPSTIAAPTHHSAAGNDIGAGDLPQKRQTAGSDPAVCVSTTSTAEEANASEILHRPTAN